VKSYAFLFWGYLVVWAGIVAYLVFLGARLSRVSRRLEQLERSSSGPKAASAR
jgi:CcmD family protein